LRGDAVLVCLDTVRVAQLDADLPFGRLLEAEALEPLLELLRLVLVEELEADGAADVAVVSLEHLRHAPLPRPAAEVPPLGVGDLRSLGPLGTAAEEFAEYAHGTPRVTGERR